MNKDGAKFCRECGESRLSKGTRGTQKPHDNDNGRKRKRNHEGDVGNAEALGNTLLEQVNPKKQRPGREVSLVFIPVSHD